MKTLLTGILSMLITTALSSADARPKQVEAGDTAPAFSMKDSSGTEQSLAGYLGTNPLILVFTRSGDW